MLLPTVSSAHRPSDFPSLPFRSGGSTQRIPRRAVRKGGSDNSLPHTPSPVVAAPTKPRSHQPRDEWYHQVEMDEPMFLRVQSVRSRSWPRPSPGASAKQTKRPARQCFLSKTPRTAIVTLHSGLTIRLMGLTCQSVGYGCSGTRLYGYG